MFQFKFLKRLNIKIFLIIIFLCLIGGINVFATTYFPEKEASPFFRNQLGFYLIGMFIFLLLSSFNYSYLKKPYLLFFIVFTIISLLILVLFLGDVVYGARRWISLGFITLQPTEFAKIGIIIISAYFLSQDKRFIAKENEMSEASSFRKKNLSQANGIGIILSFIFYLLVITLTLLQNSLGNTILITLLYIFMLFVAIDITPTMLKLGAVGGIGIILSIIIHSLNFSTTVTLWVSLITFFLFSVIVYFVQKRSALKRINTEVKSHSLYISLLFLVALFSVNILQIGYNNLQPYQQNRISSFLHPEKDPNASWNLEQSKIACGSGRITGKGFLNGTQTNYRFLPFSFTDFAYCSYAEQFGLIGNVILLTLYGTLVITILNWTDRVKDKFGKFLLYGAVIMLFLNIVQHIGMNIGLLPITGVPLPLISYGGSAIIVSFIALGIAMSVHNSDEMERTKIEKVRG